MIELKIIIDDEIKNNTINFGKTYIFIKYLHLKL